MIYFVDTFLFLCELFVTILAGAFCIVLGLVAIVVIAIVVKTIVETIIEWRRKNK